MGSVARRCRARAESSSIELRGFDGTTARFRGDLSLQGEGAGRRIVGVFVDGDDSKALRAAAQRSARMEALGSLTAGVAHDFNNLLTVLVGNLYLIGEELREQPRVFEKLKAARDAGKRGTELIKQLMTFARREELDVGTIDPSKVIADLLPLLRRALGVRITLETTLQENVGAVRASVAQLESAVVNLAVNARDAIEGKGRISIEVAAADVSDQEAPLRGLARGGRLRHRQRARYRQRHPARDARAVCSSRSFRRRASAAARASGLAWCVGSRSIPVARAAIDSVVGQGTTVTLLLPRHRRSRRPMPTTGRCRCRHCRPVPSASSCSRWTKRLRATIHQTLEVLGYRVKVASGAEDLLGGRRGRAHRLADGRWPRARRRRHLDPRAGIAAELADHRDRRSRARGASAFRASASRRSRSRSRWRIWRERCGELSTPPQTPPRALATCRAAPSGVPVPT